MKQLLKEVAIISAGQGAPQGDDSYCEDGIPFVKAGNLLELLEGKSIWTIQKVSDEIAQKHKLKLYKKGTVLFAKSGMSCLKGYVYVLPCDAYVVSHLACITPKEDISDYLLFYFNYHKPSKLIKDEAYPSISLSDIGNLEIDLKKADERAGIVTILSQTKHIIDERKEQLHQLDELVKARFVEMFGDPVENSKKWDTKSLTEMGYCKNGMNFHTGDNGVLIHCLGVGDFKDYSVINGTEHLPTISLNEEPSTESMLQDGDIVFVRSNGNKALVGRCVVVYPHGTPTTYSGFCIRYRLTSREVTTMYLLQVLKMDSMRKRMAGRGANIQNLNQQILASLDIPLPPLRLQQQYSDFVAQVDKSKVVVQQQIKDLQELLDKKMDEYFGGE